MKNRIEFGEYVSNQITEQLVLECLKTGNITVGAKTKLLEEKFAKLFNYKHSVSVSSGTSAGIAACMCLYENPEIKPGDEVICPALSFISTANSIRAAGFKPVFVDVRHDMNIDETLIESKITEKTRAINVVNLMGRPAKLDMIQRLAKEYNLMVIIDNCEGYGCSLHGKFSLDYGDLETSSHYVGHLLTGAEGGFVSTNDKNLSDVIYSVRSHGRRPNDLYFDHSRYGLNLKPSDIHACLILGQVDNFWHIFNRRRDNLILIRKSLERFEDIAWFTDEDRYATNCPHGFSMTLKPKYNHLLDNFKQHLTQSSIHWKRNFGAMPDHQCFGYLNQTGQFPIATYIGNHGIHIGCHYYLSNEDIYYIIEKLTEFFKGIR